MAKKVATVTIPSSAFASGSSNEHPFMLDLDDIAPLMRSVEAGGTNVGFYNRNENDWSTHAFWECESGSPIKGAWTFVSGNPAIKASDGFIYACVCDATSSGRIGIIQLSVSGSDVKLVGFKTSILDTDQGDDHNNGWLVELTDGRIRLVTSQHTGACWTAVMDNVSDVSSWTVQTDPFGNDNVTYPRPFYVGSRLYVSYRTGDAGNKAFWWLAYTDNPLADAPTWSNTSFSTRPMIDNSIDASPYVHFVPDSEDSSQIFVLGSIDNPNSLSSVDVYAGFIDLTAEEVKSLDGLDGTASYSNDYTDNSDNPKLNLLTKVIDGSGGGPNGTQPYWVLDAAQDADYVYAIATASQSSSNIPPRPWTMDVFWMRIDKSDGTVVVHDVDTEVGGTVTGNNKLGQHYTYGFSLDPSDPSTVVGIEEVHYYDSSGGSGNAGLAGQPPQRNLCKWVTANAGVSWTKTVLEDSVCMKRLRPYVPVGSSADECILYLAGEYAGYGDNGEGESGDFEDYDMRICSYPAMKSDYGRARALVWVSPDGSNDVAIDIYTDNDDAPLADPDYAPGNWDKCVIGDLAWRQHGNTGIGADSSLSVINVFKRSATGNNPSYSAENGTISAAYDTGGNAANRKWLARCSSSNVEFFIHPSGQSQQSDANVPVPAKDTLSSVSHVWNGTNLQGCLNGTLASSSAITGSTLGAGDAEVWGGYTDISDSQTTARPIWGSVYAVFAGGFVMTDAEQESFTEAMSMNASVAVTPFDGIGEDSTARVKRRRPMRYR